MNTPDRHQQRLHFTRTHAGPQASAPVAASSDAGFRSYWRTHIGDERSLVIMDSPPAQEDIRPWLRLHSLLHEGGVRVPAVLACDLDNGFLLLEDLGGPTLLQTLSPDNADHWFAHACEQLLRIQRIALPADFPAYDPALVQRELALFPEWFLKQHLGISLTSAEQHTFAEASARLVNTFLQQPQVLVHRDFMPRNLMPLADGVAVLDFQDAVRGPIAYDVLTSFKDAFLSWPQTRIDHWTSQWHHAMRDAGLPVPDADSFMRDIDLIGIQRHLKVLGIFARLRERDNKPRYITDAPRFVAYLDTVLPRHPELAALHRLLQQHVIPRIPPLPLPQ